MLYCVEHLLEFKKSGDLFLNNGSKNYNLLIIIILLLINL